MDAKAPLDQSMPAPAVGTPAEPLHQKGGRWELSAINSRRLQNWLIRRGTPWHAVSMTGSTDALIRGLLSHPTTFSRCRMYAAVCSWLSG